MNAQPPETERWLQDVRRGNPRALAALLDHYRPQLRQMLAMRLDKKLAARLDPSDVIQEVFLDASRQIAAYVANPRVDFYVWLRGLARQRLSNMQREHAGAQRRAVGREVPLPVESSAMLLQQLVGMGPTPSHVLAAREMRRHVQRALERLKSDDREVILMRHFEGLTNKQVAQALELSPSGATMRYGRALFRLKELLQDDLTEGESKP